MKANRKFVNADDAVSPVIAVILMVAITVVLAATVFVLVSDIGGNKGGAAPSFNINVDESNDRFTVETASGNADWSRLVVKLESCTNSVASTVSIGGATGATHIKVLPNASRTALSTGANAANCGAAQLATEKLSPTGAKMNAGEWIQFCSTAALAPNTNVKISLTDSVANVLAYSYTFTDVAAATGCT